MALSQRLDIKLSQALVLFSITSRRVWSTSRRR